MTTKITDGHKSSNHHQTGFALILVLWVLSLLIMMAGSFALSMQRETAIVANTKNNAQAMAIVESALAYTEIMLSLPDKNKRWRTDGSLYEIVTDNATIRIQLFGESGKIDINKAEEPLLTGLLSNSPLENKVQANLIGAILDWRDEDDLVHINGAEKSEYRVAGLKYGPRNRPFESIEELRLVLGMDEATYKWITPLITIHSGQPQVNIQQASKEVLMILPDIDQSLIDDYLAERLDSARQDLPAPPFPGKQAQTAQSQSSVVTVNIEVMLDTDTSTKVIAVVKNNPSNLPFQLLNWQQDSSAEYSLFTDFGTHSPDSFDDLIVKSYAEPELNR